jgi:phage-related protein
MDMDNNLQPIPISFWKTNLGREPVREFLHSLLSDDKKVVGRDMLRLQFGWPIGMPLVRKLQGPLWELRSSLPSKRELRILFVAGEDKLILLHIFIKKTQNTPKADLQLALQRTKELEQ